MGDKCILNLLHTWAGVEVSEEDIKQAVSEVVEENKATILELRYRTNGRCSVLASDGFNNSILTYCLIMTTNFKLECTMHPFNFYRQLHSVDD